MGDPKGAHASHTPSTSAHASQQPNAACAADDTVVGHSFRFAFLIVEASSETDTKIVHSFLSKAKAKHNGPPFKTCYEAPTVCVMVPGDSQRPLQEQMEEAMEKLQAEAARVKAKVVPRPGKPA